MFILFSFLDNRTQLYLENMFRLNNYFFPGSVIVIKWLFITIFTNAKKANILD